MPTIETVRGTFYYKDYRQDEITHPPLMLIHGAGGVYLDLPIELRKTMQTIALDLHGHGRSSGSGRRRIRDYAEDIVALLDALNIEKAIIAGHSMGGAIAQTLALDFADRVAGLILLGTGAHLPVNQMIIDGLESNFEKTCQNLIKWQWHKSALEQYRQRGLERLLQTPINTIRNDFLACNEFDIRERLAEITVPTLIIAAAEDKMLAQSQSEFLAEKISGAKLAILENAGHMFPLEQANQVVDIVQQWVTEKFQ
ncbi:MAG: alpha/beta fold hydrolase [Anaerolineae bacterium]|nr:alpha/beta fold hydrolase [Anaerolineae bacterium]